MLNCQNVILPSFSVPSYNDFKSVFGTETSSIGGLYSGWWAQKIEGLKV